MLRRIDAAGATQAARLGRGPAIRLRRAAASRLLVPERQRTHARTRRTLPHAGADHSHAASNWRCKTQAQEACGDLAPCVSLCLCTCPYLSAQEACSNHCVALRACVALRTSRWRRDAMRGTTRRGAANGWARAPAAGEGDGKRPACRRRVAIVDADDLGVCFEEDWRRTTPESSRCRAPQYTEALLAPWLPCV